MNIDIKPTTCEHIDRLLEIYQAARAFMRRTGNLHQWNNNYPSAVTVEEDIKRGGSYVVEIDGRIVATFFFIIGDDPTYKNIYNGEWLNSKPYGVIHRVASDGSYSGIMKLILDFCFQQIENIRIDTHRDNKVMQNALLRYGFIYRGIIYLANGDERLAYQCQKAFQK